MLSFSFVLRIIWGYYLLEDKMVCVRFYCWSRTPQHPGKFSGYYCWVFLICVGRDLFPGPGFVCSLKCFVSPWSLWPWHKQKRPQRTENLCVCKACPMCPYPQQGTDGVNLWFGPCSLLIHLVHLWAHFWWPCLETLLWERIVTCLFSTSCSRFLLTKDISSRASDYVSLNPVFWTVELWLYAEFWNMA